MSVVPFIDNKPKPLYKKVAGVRLASLMRGGIAFALVAGIVIASMAMGEFGIRADFSARMEAPNWAHWFGTDFMGRDIFARTIHGLSLSLWVGLIGSGVSTLLATVLAVVAVAGGRVGDAFVSLLVDVTMGLPHLVLLILIAFAFGGGTNAVIIAVALTHWPRLTRILRAEILQIRNADYIRFSRNFGKSWFSMGVGHMVPHLLPQMLVGMILMFPHAIMHEAGLTFLGFGLEPSRPAIGILLSESMRYLTAGYWWLGLFPGLCLLVTVLCFDAIGEGLRTLLDPRGSQE